MAADGIRQDWRKYTSKNDGRHDFQIDLGIALLNAAIEYDLAHKDALGYSGEYPNWMKQGSLDPCECGMCYFCINRLTNGIAHKDTVKRKVAKKNKKEVVECSDVREGLMKADGTPLTYSDYCRMCYRKLDGAMKDDKPLTAKEKKKKCLQHTITTQHIIAIGGSI